MDLRTVKIMKHMLESKLLAAKGDEVKGMEKSIKLIMEQIEYLETTPEIDGTFIQTTEELSELWGL